MKDFFGWVSQLWHAHQATYKSEPLPVAQSLPEVSEAPDFLESPCEIWDMLIPTKPRRTGFPPFATARAAYEFLARLDERSPGLSLTYVVRALDSPLKTIDEDPVI